MTQCNSVLEFKQKAFKMGICEEYRKQWQQATSNKDLADMAMSIQGADFLCASVVNQWGGTKEQMMFALYDFANGNYVRRGNGYTSELFLYYEGKITVKSTLYIVIGSEDVEIYVPRYRIANIYLAGCKNVKINCNGAVYIVNYDKDSKVKIVRGNDETVHIVDPSEITDSWAFKHEAK